MSRARLQGLMSCRLHAVAVAVAACMLLTVLAGCGPGRPAGRNIVVITLDTTRADHVSAYGYPPRTTPHADALAVKGMLFEQAYAPMPQTLPSHSSMFTGLMPRHHGALENHDVLPDTVQTLAEVLRERGYDTAACIAAAVLDHTTGIQQGFATFDEPHGIAKNSQHPVERRGDAVTDAALAWAQSARDRDKPFFLWAHYYDAHGPFEAPDDSVPLPIVEAQVSALAGAFTDSELDLKSIARLWCAYDNEIAYADEQVHRLLSGLAAEGLLDNTVIAIVGDHGEGLMQHGEKGHGVLIFEEALKVPFLLVAPDGELAGTRLERPVHVADLTPSLLTLAGLAPMPGPQDGEDLVTALRSGRAGSADDAAPVFSERPHYSKERLAWRNGASERFAWGLVAGVRLGKDKLIRDTDGSIALFDLVDDPHELHDLGADPASAATRERLTRALNDWLAAHPAPEPGSHAEPDDERNQALRQLGY